MNNPTYTNVHNRFKLNGFQLDREDLCRVAYSFIKEGDDFEKPVGIFILDWFDDKSTITLNSSGTTGKPKSFEVEKQAMVNSAIATGDFFDLSPGNKVLHCLPANYIAGKMMFVRGFILGLELDFVAPTSNPLDRNENEYDFVAMVPLQVQNSLDKLDKVKKLIVGGANLNQDLEEKLKELTKTIVYETYGMTETLTHIAAKKIGEDAFTVLPNITISQDDRQCLVISAPHISDEEIVTNDLIGLLSDNRFVWLGRVDNVVNSGGIKLIPEQIEEKLRTKIAGRFFLTGTADHDLGEKLVLVIEGPEYPIDASIFEDLGKYEKPKEIFFVRKFEETTSGKLRRKETLNMV